MPELNHLNAKTPQELRRLAVLADVDTKDLMAMTGLDESTINKYFNDACTRQNYLFQFALEHLAEAKLISIGAPEQLLLSPAEQQELINQQQQMTELLEMAVKHLNNDFLRKEVQKFINNNTPQEQHP